MKPETYAEFQALQAELFDLVDSFAPIETEAGFIPAMELATRTHCDAGHELSIQNIMHTKGGQARCRQCHNAYMNEYRRSRKQEQSA